MSGQNVNLQESFLNHVRKEGIAVEVAFLNGARIQGQVRGFDNFTVIMHVDGKQHLLYKHAIAELIAPKFPSRPRHESADGSGENRTEGAEENRLLPRPAHARRRENGLHAGMTESETPADGNPQAAGESERAKPEKFNPIDLSAIKIEVSKSTAKVEK